MNSKFFKDHMSSFMMIGATVVLAGVAVFTAVRLYQLRGEPVAPTAGTESQAAIDRNIGVINTNSLFFDEITFVNLSGQDRNMDFLRDSWDDDSLDELIRNVMVPAGGSYTVTAFPGVCTDFQVDARFSDDVQVHGEDYWGRGWVVFKANNPNCDTTTPTTPPTTTEPRVDLEPCTALMFSLAAATATPTPTATPTATATATATATPTATATATATPTATATATATATPIAQASPTPQAELPAAGIGLPTILGAGLGILLLAGALLLAF